MLGWAGTGIFRTTDNGNHWYALPFYNFNVLSLATDQSGLIFAGTFGHGLFRSTDNGANWTDVTAGLSNDNITSLLINSSGHVLAGPGAGGIFRSTNNGSNWTQVLATPNTYVLSLTLNANGHIFAGTGNGYVFRSTDNGLNWTQILIASNKTVLSLASAGTQNIFAGTDAGVFRSTNDGTNWNQLNDGLTNTYIAALAFNSSGVIFAGTGGGRVFRSSQPITSVQQFTTRSFNSFHLAQNYPNPFNPTTVIEYQIPPSPFSEKGEQGGFVSLKVYDILGREVIILVNEVKQAGNYTVTWDASNMPSGVYFSRLQYGGKSLLKKLVLMK